MSDAVSRAQARRARRRAEAEEAAGEMNSDKRAALNEKNKAVQSELEAERKAWREKNARGVSSPRTQTDDLDEEGKLFAKVDELQDKNQESLANSIRMASEATQSANATIDQLARQREQLTRMDNALDDTNASLNRSERIIRGMKSIGGSISNWFTKPKAHVSQKSEITKKIEAGQRVEVADDAALSRDLSSKRDRDDRLTGRTTSTATRNATASVDIKIDEKQFKNTRSDDDFTAEQKQKLSKIEQRQAVEDEQLDVLSGLLTQLHHQAKDIHGELNVQHQLIDDVGHHVDSTSARIQNANRQIAKIT